MTDILDQQTRQLAAMAYGEASSRYDDLDEMSAVASVLIHQRDARGYSDMAMFTSSEPTFSFVVRDGNERYSKLMKASEKDIDKNKGMKAAVVAAKNALAGGADKSNGAYFWDGADIKTNYKHHFKVKQGIKFTDPAHNIYAIKESTKLVIKYKITKKKIGGKLIIEKKETGRYDYVYESTAAHGGSIFWKFGKDYLDVTHSKGYK